MGAHRDGQDSMHGRTDARSVFMLPKSGLSRYTGWNRGAISQFPRPRLAPADHQPDYLRARRFADLFRHARYQMAQCLVETGVMGVHRAGVDVGGHVDRLSYAT